MPVKNEKIWSIPKEEFEKHINLGKTLREIAKEFNVCKTTITEVFKLLGLHSHGEEESYKKRAKVNIYKFDSIDTEEKAYWLGFLYADGCVSITKKDYSVIIELAKVDLDHLIKFKKFLEDKRDDSYIKIYTKKKKGIKDTLSCFYRAHSKYLAQALVKLGCYPRKSLTLKFPDESIFVRKELIYDFIRGYVDGDGCIFNSFGRIGIGIVGTFDFLSGIQRYFPQFSKIYHGKGKKIYEIRCTSSKADQITYRLYEHASIYLDRKYERYVALCKLHDSEKSDKIGESCDANAEVTPEIAKGSESTVENSE